MAHLRVGVLMGGKSVEHEVSFNSGRTVCDHLDRSLFTVIPLYQTISGLLYILPWQFLHRGKTTDFNHRLKNEAELISWDALKKTVDFVFIATHGRYAEDGTLQGMLEILNIPYLGSKTLASAISMDKSVQKKIMAHNGINVPLGITVSASIIQKKDYPWVKEQLVALGCAAPWIVKPHKEGSSLGVSYACDDESLYRALEHACFVDPEYAQDVLVEQKIEGMEFSCIILTDYKTGRLIPLPPTEIEIEQGTYWYDYEQKYMPGRAVKHTPARCGSAFIEQIQQTCLRVMNVLEFKNMGRIDGFLTPEGTIIIVDPNILSGMAPASFLFREAAEIGMGHAQLINHLIKTELHQYGMLDGLIDEKKAQKIMNTKKRIAVLMGGCSHEREISLESGRNITYKLDTEKYEAVPLFVNESMELFKIAPALLVRNSTHEIASLVSQDMRVMWSDLPTIADFVFIALHGGHGENGDVQGALEMLGIPYNGSSVLASALCMNKYACNTFLRNEGFDVPRSMLITKEQWQSGSQDVLDAAMAALPFPLIVKPHDDGCSVMVQKIEDAQALQQSIQALFDSGKMAALVEECIVGVELTVGVIGNQKITVLPPSQVVVAKGILSIEEKFLPGAGENQTPALLPQEAITYIQKTIEAVFRAVGCKGYARIDCFYQQPSISPTGLERVIILEINSLPGMTPATCIFHQAAEIGMSPSDFIDTLISLGFEQHQITKTLHLDQKHPQLEI